MKFFGQVLNGISFGGKDVVGERFKKFKHHPHISLLHVINLVGHKPDEFLLKLDQYACDFVDFIKPVDYYLFELLHSIGIEDDVGHFADVDVELLTVFLQCIDGVGYS